MKILFYFFLLIAIYRPLNAQVDPSIDWKVLEEDHAVWIYDSQNKALVDQYSKNFKKLYPSLQKMFKEVPRKTTFVISDYTDRPNGSATVFPYPLVTIYPVIPLPNSPIGETDDSLYEILLHEYTHILNMHPVHGGMRALSWIFGSIIRPNTYLPRWYAEGLAVFTESYFTQRGGRLRSQNFEGMARAISQSKEWNLFPIDTLNDSEPDWMGGRRAYLLGGALMYEIAESHGIDKIYYLNQRYSRRVPYLINGPVEKATAGEDYSDLLGDAYRRLQTRADLQIKTISQSPVTQGQALLKQGFHNSRPMISPNGRYLAIVSRDHNIPAQILLYTRGESGFLKGEPISVAFAIEINDLAWSPDSRLLAYNAVETYKRFYEYSDIRVYNVERKKTEKITSGARAGDLLFSEDQKSLYFVQNTPGAKQLARWDFASKKWDILYDPQRIGTNIYSLVFDQNRILFIEQFSDKRSLKAYDLGTRTTATLTENITTSRLRKTAAGILITSSQSGVDNLYLMNPLQVITNSRTRILDGDMDPIDNSLIYSEQTPHGFDVFVQPQQSWQEIKVAPQVEPLLKIPTPNTADTEVSNTTPAQEQTIETREKDFSPLPYLWPRYWMPFANVIDGGVSFQASTGSIDPLGKNAYNLLFEWDTLTKKAGATFGYTNTSTPVELGFTASQVYRYNYTNESSLRDTSFSVGGSYDIPFMFRNWTLGINWRQSETEFPTRTYRRGGPSVNLGFSNAIQRGYEISPESGLTTSLSHQAYIEDMGNLGYNKTNINFKTYFSKWLPERNVLFFQLNGTYAPELETSVARPTTGFYTSTLNGNFFNNLLIPPFLMRGYTSGLILGNNMLSANLEYRFPITRVYRGFGTFPFFIKRLHGAIVADAVGLDGFRWSNQNYLTSAGAQGFVRERFGDNWFAGYGAELNIECTAGYYLPVTLSFGVYRGENRDLATEDLSYFFMFRF